MMFIAEIRGKGGHLVFSGQPYDNRDDAARYAFRYGPQNAKECSTSVAVRDPAGNWKTYGSDIRWHKRRELWREPAPACDVGLFSEDPRQVDLTDLL